MRSFRLLLVACVLTAFAVVLVPDALALRFADRPCSEAGDERIRVCPDAIAGRIYSIKLTGEGGCGPGLPYQYRILNGTLPPGVSLSREGELAGTPTTAGDWDFWIELSDQDPPSAAWCVPARSEREFRIHVGAPVATVGSPYSLPLGAAGVGAQRWSLVSGILPAGLALDPAAGVIAGIPASPGSFPVRFSAVDTNLHVVFLDLALTVYPRLTFTTARLAPARVGRSFGARVRTQGAVGSVRFRVIAGRLPVGIRLNGSTGVLRGTPRKAGIYRVTVEALDSLGRAATRSLVLRVRQSLAKSK